ncbi:VAMP synaptobrevin-like protein [Flagelloscypha sp. PMI_526]|nr:VAMP synaptobrevin-like protein [Flagelloscypha sp. PMI_526]
MSLLHALVARGKVVLAEGSTGSKDFSSATQTILSKIPPGDSKMTYVLENYLFHYVAEGGFTYLVMGEDAAGRRLPFGFLAELERKFHSAPSGSSAASDTPAYGLQGTFGRVISDLLNQYNTAPPEDEVQRAQAELNQVKDIMVKNVEQILSRGERLELLMNKTDQMAGQATAFRRGARSVRRQMWWKNTKILILSCLVALIILWIIVAQFCGLSLSQCGPSK